VSEKRNPDISAIKCARQHSKAWLWKKKFKELFFKKVLKIGELNFRCQLPSKS
jgi:hypothetical protein